MSDPTGLVQASDEMTAADNGHPPTDTDSDSQRSPWLLRIVVAGAILMVGFGVLLLVLVDQASTRAEKAAAARDKVTAQFVADIQALRDQVAATGQTPVIPEPSPAVVAAAAGAAGPIGPPGPAGRMPTETEIAAAVAGYCSTDACRGSAGRNGTDGRNGIDGALSTVPGPIGATGPVGAPGAPGALGATGATGATGPPGPVGSNGSNGVDGVPGQPGPAGNAGPAGPAGSAGPAGADSVVAGPIGPPGPAGADSAVPGPTGPTGPAGAPGPSPASITITVAGTPFICLPDATLAFTCTAVVPTPIP